MDSKPKWLSVNQAAKELGISTQGCFYHVQRGALRARKYRGEWRIAPEAVEEFKSKRDSGEARVFRKSGSAPKKSAASETEKSSLETRVEALEREAGRLSARIEELEGAKGKDKHGKWGLLSPLADLLDSGR